MDIYAGVAGGKAQAAQYKAEAALAERQAQDVDLQALQTSEQTRENLRSSLAAVEARRAAAGLSLDSPSGMAIESEMRRQAVRSEQAGNVGFNNQKYSLRMGAAAKRTSASNALTLGWVNGTIAASKTASQAIAVAG